MPMSEEDLKQKILAKMKTVNWTDPEHGLEHMAEFIAMVIPYIISNAEIDGACSTGAVKGKVT